jgi:hypothetical protein
MASMVCSPSWTARPAARGTADQNEREAIGADRVAKRGSDGRTRVPAKGIAMQLDDGPLARRARSVEPLQAAD